MGTLPANGVRLHYREARRIAGGIPGAQLEIVPAAGHVSTVEQPDKVTELIAGFLEEVRSV